MMKDANASSPSSPVHLFGPRPFVIYTDHASLRTATNPPRLSQRMVRWLSFFAEYNFRVEYKLGKLNGLADALSRRPDYELAHVSQVTTDLYDRIRLEYQSILAERRPCGPSDILVTLHVQVGAPQCQDI
ncbi:Pol protein [Phytophthora palmivora]|uniref:Pol protein n=1 Tax=Phytophthora palmivora TaxID=4796 RepID=A0A2P4XN00_9STRA|nr:Pol protein [Phytophthora palmivora]